MPISIPNIRFAFSTCSLATTDVVGEKAGGGGGRKRWGGAH